MIYKEPVSFHELSHKSEVKNDYLNKNTTPSIVLTVLGVYWLKDLRDDIYAHSLWVRIVNSKKSKEKGAGRLAFRAQGNQSSIFVRFQ